MTAAVMMVAWAEDCKRFLVQEASGAGGFWCRGPKQHWLRHTLMGGGDSFTFAALQQIISFVILLIKVAIVIVVILLLLVVLTATKCNSGSHYGQPQHIAA